ncbi:ATP-binding Cassette (ABC) Superfamily, partial [Pseudoloma neurophilia]
LNPIINKNVFLLISRLFLSFCVQKKRPRNSTSMENLADKIRKNTFEWKNINIKIAKSHFGYKTSQVELITEAFGRIENGLLAIMGPSGSGKTTLINAFVGRIPENAHTTG